MEEPGDDRYSEYVPSEPLPPQQGQAYSAEAIYESAAKLAEQYKKLTQTEFMRLNLGVEAEMQQVRAIMAPLERAVQAQRDIITPSTPQVVAQAAKFGRNPRANPIMQNVGRAQQLWTSATSWLNALQNPQDGSKQITNRTMLSEPGRAKSLKRLSKATDVVSQAEEVKRNYIRRYSGRYGVGSVGTKEGPWTH